MGTGQLPGGKIRDLKSPENACASRKRPHIYGLNRQQVDLVYKIHVSRLCIPSVYVLGVDTQWNNPLYIGKTLISHRFLRVKADDVVEPICGILLFDNARYG